jgi:hypothetical protein
MRLHVGDLRANRRVFGDGAAAITRGTPLPGWARPRRARSIPVPDVEHVAPRADTGTSTIVAESSVDANPSNQWLTVAAVKRRLLDLRHCARKDPCVPTVLDPRRSVLHVPAGGPHQWCQRGACVGKCGLNSLQDHSFSLDMRFSKAYVRVTCTTGAELDPPVKGGQDGLGAECSGRGPSPAMDGELGDEHEMTEHARGVTGVVMAIPPRHRSRSQCSCGWIGKPHLLVSSARIDALLHAAQFDCEPAIPLVQPEISTALTPPGMLIVECPAGCGETFLVPVSITGPTDDREAECDWCAPFVAVAPDLHDILFEHLRNCPALRRIAAAS